MLMHLPACSQGLAPGGRSTNEADLGFQPPARTWHPTHPRGHLSSFPHGYQESYGKARQVASGREGCTTLARKVSWCWAPSSPA